MISFNDILSPQRPRSIIENHGLSMLSPKPSFLSRVFSRPPGLLIRRLLSRDLFLDFHDEIRELSNPSPGVFLIDQPCLL